MALKLFEFRKQNVIDNFSINLTQLDKTGSTILLFISLGNLIIKIHVQNENSITFFVTFTLWLFDSVVFFPFNKGNECNLTRNQKSNRKKINLRLKKFKIFLRKKTRKSIRPI